MPSEIKVLATTAMKTSLDELAPDFERATGNKLSFSFGPSARITKMVADGEETDVAIVTDQGLKDLTGQGKLVPGSGADIARSAMALAVQKGAAKPDISSGAKFKAALLAALAYFVLPIDMVPDVLPLLGFADDAAVLATAIRMVAAHLRPEHRDAARRAIARELRG